MRGKNIVWLTLMVALVANTFGLLFVNTATGLEEVGLRIVPDRIPGGNLFGHTGDTYEMAITVENVTNLWNWGMEIHVRPFASVLSASEFASSGWLEDGWPVGTPPFEKGGGTFLAVNIDALNGIIYIAETRLEKQKYEFPTGWVPVPREGKSGDGTLLTFKFTVLGAGDSPIDMKASGLQDPDGNLIPHIPFKSYYHGVTVKAVTVSMPDGRHITAGDTFTFTSKVKNEGDVPLEVRTRYDIDRAEDARKIIIRSGQFYAGGGLGEPRPYQYLYVDEFNEWYYEWNNPATNLFGVPDGNYIMGDANAQWASLYSFQDIILGGKEIADIFLEGYARYPNGFTEAVDIDVYDVTGGFIWWGSLWATDSWGWYGTRWVGASVLDEDPDMADETYLNNVQVLIYNYHGDAPDIIELDSMRLRVEFAGITPVVPPVYVIQPGETLDLEVVTWASTDDHIGSYDATATIEYREPGGNWNSWGSKPKSFHFWIEP